MKLVYSIDRFEGDFAVVVCDDGRVLEINVEKLGDLRERDVFSADEVDGKLYDIIPLPEERERRLAAARERLNRFKAKSNS